MDLIHGSSIDLCVMLWRKFEYTKQNAPVISGFNSQRASNAELLLFYIFIVFASTSCWTDNGIVGDLIL